MKDIKDWQELAEKRQGPRCELGANIFWAEYDPTDPPRLRDFRLTSSVDISRGGFSIVNAFPISCNLAVVALYSLQEASRLVLCSPIYCTEVDQHGQYRIGFRMLEPIANPFFEMPADQPSEGAEAELWRLIENVMEKHTDESPDDLLNDNAPDPVVQESGA